MKYFKEIFIYILELVAFKKIYLPPNTYKLKIPLIIHNTGVDCTLIQAAHFHFPVQFNFSL